MGIVISASTVFAFGMMPAREVVSPRKSASVAPMETFEGERLRLCVRRHGKNSLHSSGVGGGVGVEGEYVLEAGKDEVEAFGDHGDDLDEPP